MFDNILEVARTWEGGSAWCLSGPLKGLAYSRIVDLSLLQHKSTSQEKHGRLRTTSLIFPSSIYCVPEDRDCSLGPGDRRLVLRLVLVSSH